MMKYRKIYVFYNLSPVDAAFYSVCGETSDGKLETIEVVDVLLKGGTEKVNEYILRFAADGIPVEFDWFARRIWGRER
jgi:hypothetical protein